MAAKGGGSNRRSFEEPDLAEARQDAITGCRKLIVFRSPRSSTYSNDEKAKHLQDFRFFNNLSPPTATISPSSTVRHGLQRANRYESISRHHEPTA
jgi:hypothetical protein